MAVVAIGGDNLVTLLLRHLHADDDSFLADIEVTEPTDKAHAIELAGLFLETADQQHFTIGVKILVLAEVRGVLARKLLGGGFRG